MRSPRRGSVAVVVRSLQVARVFARHALEARLQRSTLGRWMVHRRLTGPERLRAGLEELGGSFVKLGQLLATQHELLSEDTCRALYDLLDRVTPVPYPKIAAVFAEDRGTPIEAAFDRVDPRPLASASIAQVHRAWRAGACWAVKIQRPEAERVFARDLAVMASIARWVRRSHVRGWAWIADSLEEFGAWTERELDFRWEARYADEIRRRGDARRVRVPRVDPTRSGRRVLTAEMVDGPTLVDHLRQPDVGWTVPGFDLERLVDRIVETFLTDAFRSGLFHADLHPGNLVILPDGVPGYVDFGIVGRLSPHARRHLLGMTLAFARGDVEALLANFERLAGEPAPRDLRRFRSGVRRAADGWFRRRGGTVVLTRRFPQLMLEMTRISRRTRVWPHREVVLYVRSVVATDGLVARLAPGYDLEGKIRAVASRLVAERAVLDLLAPERLLLALAPTAGVAAAPEAPADERRRGPVPALVRLAAALGGLLLAAAGARTVGWEVVETIAARAVGGLGLLGLFLGAWRR